MNNTQPIDLTQNQIMHSIFCHHQTIILEVLALHTRSRKWLTTCHKSNGIIAMKKHIEVEHNNLLKRYVEEIIK
jgi:hypothetical protein